METKRAPLPGWMEGRLTLGIAGCSANALAASEVLSEP